MASPKLILASASPRRKDLLAAADVAFEIVQSGIDETRVDHEAAEAYALRMACEKALYVSRRRTDALVLGADTIVELHGEILLKPLDAADARRMLLALSANTHTVVTAFAIARAGRLLESAPVTARVTFHHLAPSAIDAYVATGEPLDKAGSYGIQSGGADFIATVAGARDTVMGLPVLEVLAALRRQGFDAG
ncbi:MAG TPA: Maf family protein [Candidatus Binataceae bacterium]|nr:Maf family protein [Candidatus Binataceae bacterium]